MVKFLIVRFSSIGDIVLTTPLVRCLKQQVEDAEVHYVTKKQYSSILTNNPYIDKVHILEDSFDKMFHELRDEMFDYIIDLHRNLRTYRLKSKLKHVAFAFEKLNYQKWLLTNFKINKMPDVHIVDRYMDTCRVFDVVNDNKGLDYFIDPKDEVDLSSLSENFQNGYIAFVIGAKHNTKRLPVSKIISICKKIAKPIIILGGKEDAEEGNQIVKKAGEHVLNTCGKYNISQSASLVKQANCVITHDTGLMHIASAFKKKIISVWGSTVPDFGMYPYLPDEASKIIEVKNLKCRPCSKIGFKQCPKKHFKCMNDINEDQIIEQLSTIN